jgi:hypothetical protein
LSRLLDAGVSVVTTIDARVRPTPVVAMQVTRAHHMHEMSPKRHTEPP